MQVRGWKPKRKGKDKPNMNECWELTLLDWRGRERNIYDPNFVALTTKSFFSFRSFKSIAGKSKPIGFVLKCLKEQDRRSSVMRDFIFGLSLAWV